ncbi:uncharacterized protein SPPG_03582 [Spizellomyces punctatus DAOM BR117]|uniref:GCF C-terminal domain-containing protein n=1 Tax=Spizellomyces punctatus (strain DAOM BR117) TaxID=645134 RepID=A0A0L0HK02_SPIPD|nr:uncharacterized protein SPPG_03582 [Spizellomyces punctatus DAOM BR117]KND01791.1 hypothetical protein SPPG_03582 [Spizellomyces punctatus DAOM BR117]|eukprot:XP_016609830.1 hypothetical protein SPPG_03582 [Spizellomyces punctatus DAOM BR117]
MSFASFRKPKAKNLRKKIQVYEDEDGSDNVALDGNGNGREGKTGGELEVKAIANSIKKEGKSAQKPKAKPKGGTGVALSFGEDDEGTNESFTIKKTAASRRMTKAKVNRELVPERTVDAFANGNYSTESLRALKESQRTAPPSSGTTDSLFSSSNMLADDLAPLSLAESIPDAATIHAARKLREQKRAAAISGAKESSVNFIPLSSSREVGQSYKHESRLVTEDEEIEGEEAFEDYEGDRITFGREAVKQEEERRQKEMEGNLIHAQEEDVEDEEVRRWEMEQIRKGRKPKVHDAKPEPQSRPPAPAQIPASIPIPSVSAVCSRLASTLSNLEATHENHIRQLEQIKHEAQKSTIATASLESDTKGSSERYTYFQDLKTYIEDLADFLDTKFPELESLEMEYHSIIKARNKLIFEQREKVMDDWFATFAIWTAPPQETNGQMPFGEMETDEVQQPTNEAELASRLGRVRQRLEHLFDDTDDEFRSLPIIKKRFEIWKRKYPKDYEDGYGSLSVPGIFELFVRGELLTQSLQDIPIVLEAMEWHRTLMDYGITSPHVMNADDPDTKLLSRIAEKAVIPRIKALVDTYDPNSEEQTNALINIMGQCLDYVHVEDQAFKGLVSAIEMRLTRTTDATVDRYNFFVTRLRPSLTEAMIESRNHWFWITFKLFMTVLKWGRYLPRATVQSLAIDKLLNRQLIPIVRVASSGPLDLDKLEKIAEGIPAGWIAEGTVFLASFDAALKDFIQRHRHGGYDQSFWNRLAKVAARIQNHELAAQISHQI